MRKGEFWYDVEMTAWLFMGLCTAMVLGALAL